MTTRKCAAKNIFSMSLKYDIPENGPFLKTNEELKQWDEKPLIRNEVLRSDRGGKL
jgi:hypothetical protein